MKKKEKISIYKMSYFRQFHEYNNGADEDGLTEGDLRQQFDEEVQFITQSEYEAIQTANPRYQQAAMVYYGPYNEWSPATIDVVDRESERAVIIMPDMRHLRATRQITYLPAFTLPFHSSLIEEVPEQ